MPRKVISHHRGDQGQALVLFAAGLVALVGCVAMSIDVGRLVWARTQMQAAVDAAALAAAQSMPSTTDAAAKANEYWLENSGFIRGQGENVQFAVTYPPGNKRISVRGDADIPTWFAKIFGIDHWHVSAEGDAESQVLDIALVLDISSSMCDGSWTPVDNEGAWIGPGRVADQVRLTSAIGTGTPDSITIDVNNTAIFNSTSSAQNYAKFGYNTSTRYYSYTPSSGRRGLIKIDNEIFLITAIPSATQLTVNRAERNNWTGVNGVQANHAVNAVLYSQHANCFLSAPAPTGPYDYYDGMIADAQYFTTLFNPLYDQLGVATFSTDLAFPGYSTYNGNQVRRYLTSNFAQVQSDLTAIRNPDGYTNSAYGVALGRLILDGAGKRANASRVLIFLTDGLANTVCGSPYNAANYNNAASCPGETYAGPGSTANNSAYSEAVRVANDAQGPVTIFTIGFGPYADADFLKRIADGGTAGVGPCQNNRPGCRYYQAPTLADLANAFTSIAAQTHISLVR